MTGDEVVVDGLDGEERPSTFYLEFVNMNTTSATEKLRNQKVIRSTAMKNFRRKQKSQRAQQAKEISDMGSTGGLNPSSQQQRRRMSSDKQFGESESDEGTYCNITKEASQEALDVSSQAIDDWISENSSDGSWFKSQRTSGTTNTSDKHCTWNRSAVQGQITSVSKIPYNIFTRHSLLTVIGGGRADPFRTYPVQYVGPEADALIDHSTFSLWPGLRPGAGNGAHNDISSAWLSKVTSKPLVMHALLFGGAVHLDILRSPLLNMSNPIRLFHKVQTLKLLKEELKHPGSSDPDDLILTVLCLGANEVETMMDTLKPKIRSPFDSPLSSSQWLDVYGSMSHIRAHTLAMRLLVDRRGGLENIQLEGLAEVIEFSDILGATQNLSKPYWKLLERTVKANVSSHRGSSAAHFPLKCLGQGFQALRTSGISGDAEIVLQSLADLTIIIERYCRGIAPVPGLSYVVARRNYVQHALLSLPAAGELEFTEISSFHLYETIRYTALIYSVGVTFPMPPVTGIFDVLTTRLKTILEASKDDLCWQMYPRTLLWVLTIGGIAAGVTENKRWFVHSLSVVSAALDISKWLEVVEEMRQYLWLERACDISGRNLWQEVLQCRFLDVKFMEEDDEI